MALDLWFRPDIARILQAAEQAARRDKTGERKEGALEVIDDLRVTFGLPEKQAGYVIEAIRERG